MTNPNDLTASAFDAENDFDNLGGAFLRRLIPNPNGGLTKREYFAAMAMQGLLAESKINEATVAILAVDYADELIKRLNKEQTK